MLLLLLLLSQFTVESGPLVETAYKELVEELEAEVDKDTESTKISKNEIERRYKTNKENNREEKRCRLMEAEGKLVKLQIIRILLVFNARMALLLLVHLSPRWRFNLTTIDIDYLDKLRVKKIL